MRTPPEQDDAPSKKLEARDKKGVPENHEGTVETSSVEDTFASMQAGDGPVFDFEWPTDPPQREELWRLLRMKGARAVLLDRVNGKTIRPLDGRSLRGDAYSTFVRIERGLSGPSDRDGKEEAQVTGYVMPLHLDRDLFTTIERRLGKPLTAIKSLAGVWDVSRGRPVLTLTMVGGRPVDLRPIRL